MAVNAIRGVLQTVINLCETCDSEQTCHIGVNCAITSNLNNNTKLKNNSYTLHIDKNLVCHRLLPQKHGAAKSYHSKVFTCLFAHWQY